jgi:integrase
MRGSIRPRGDGYEISVSAGIDPVTGKRKRIYRWARGKREAERVLTDLLKAVDSGSFADAGKLTIADYLRDTWLPHVATRVRPRTALRYRQLLEGHVISIIGSVKLAKLRPAHVQQVIDCAISAGLAPRTVAGVYRTLHGALAQAIRWQLLAVNAAAAIRPPRSERPKLQAPDTAKVAKVLNAARGTRLYVPIAVAASTGLRRGELLALRWSEVALDAGSLRVTASLQRSGAALSFLPPKTDRGRRTVGLPPATVALLRRHRKEQLERRVLLGEAWADLDLVIERGDGEPFPPDSLSRDWYRLVRRIGLPGLRLHDLRHAYATALLEAGVHPKVASEALGHSSVSFTMDTYQHLMPTMQDAATRAIEEALGTVIGGTLAVQPDKPHRG